MGDFLDRFRGPLLFFGLVICAFITMIADHRSSDVPEQESSWWASAVLGITTPVQKMIAAPIEGVQSIWSDYVALVDVEAENQALKHRIAELEEENLQYQEALVASGRLQRIADMKGDVQMAMLPSEVVGQDVSTWIRSVLIDRGREQGVYSGMPVVTDQGVVGVITATADSAAKTMLLLDRQSAIDGVVQRTRVRGIVRGVGNDRLELEFVPGEDSVHVGDVVISSGLGGVYPKGLRIGKVVEVVESTSSGLLQRAILQPATDFDRLEQVFVLLWRGQTMELLYEAGDTSAKAKSPPSPKRP